MKRDLEARNSEALRLRGEGLSNSQIAARLNITRAAVAGIFSRAGLTRKAPITLRGFGS